MPTFPLPVLPRDRRFVAFLALAAVLLACVALGLLVLLLAALLAYSLVKLLSARLVLGRMPRGGARLAALLLVALLIIGLLSGAAAGGWYFLRSPDGYQHLLERMGEVLLEAHRWLPAVIAERMPERDALFAEIGGWLKSHSGQIGGVGLQAAKQFGYALLGIVLGALVAVTDINRDARMGPISHLLVEQMHAFNRAFGNVAAAQVRISLFNTLLTALYLFALLPAFGIELPLRKTMTAVTFLTGLLPVVGNLLSNTVITIIGVGHSLPVGIASILYLVLIHKLEYFLNARLVGGHINAHAWEILLVMILGERLFGMAGVVFAPVFYAWLKAEWHAWDTLRAAPADDPAAGPTAAAPGRDANRQP